VPSTLRGAGAFSQTFLLHDKIRLGRPQPSWKYPPRCLSRSGTLSMAGIVRTMGGESVAIDPGWWFGGRG